ncbi:MAG: HD domain-containing protein [Bacilli bacterium]|nr:HD domain-containing protein [Bacilli bacterium]MBR3209867.1 HD domain-containing protein [Bacilli bacterium]
MVKLKWVIIVKAENFKDELKYIKKEKYRENAKKLIELLPDYFFEVAASSTGKYHPSFALGDGGLLRHTKVAVKIANELLNDESIGYTFTEDEKDLMIISLIMHDGLKHGISKEKYTRFDHPIIMANFIEENKDKLTLTEGEVKFIEEAISSHMGPWNTNPYSDVVLPKPKNKYQRFVHMCDYLASRKFLDVKFIENTIIS